MLARATRLQLARAPLRRALSSKGVSVRAEAEVEVSKPKADKSSMSSVRAPPLDARAHEAGPRPCAPASLASPPPGVFRRGGRARRRLPARVFIPARPPCPRRYSLPTETAQFTGAPTGMLESRTVRIFQQSPSVETGTQNTLPWRMQWEDDQTRRWTNPLMGWSSTSDPLSNTHMTLEFESSEDAVRFCERNGWASEVVQPKPNNSMHAKPRLYAANFSWKGPKGRDFPDLYVPPPPPPPKD